MKTVWFLLLCMLLAYLIFDLNKTQEAYSFSSPTNMQVPYDMNTSIDAHRYALQKTCEEKGLSFVDDGMASYCIIDNEERCKLRDKELNDSGKMAFWTTDVQGRGVCVEMISNIRTFCDGQGLPLQYGALVCDKDRGFCMPKTLGFTGPFDFDALSDQTIYDLTTCEIPYRFVKDTTICNNADTPPSCTSFSTGEKVCRGIDWRGTGDKVHRDSNGVALADCVTTNTQAVVQGILGSDTFYKRYREVGEKTQEACERGGPGSSECWNAIGQLSAIPVDVMKQTGQQWFSQSYPKLYEKWRIAAENPSMHNTFNMLLSLRQNKPSNWSKAKLGKMMDGLFGGIPKLKNIYPKGLGEWIGANVGQLKMAAAVQLFDLLNTTFGGNQDIPGYEGTKFKYSEKESIYPKNYIPTRDDMINVIMDIFKDTPS
jgi:hypothetical protein